MAMRHQLTLATRWRFGVGMPCAGNVKIVGTDQGSESPQCEYLIDMFRKLSEADRGKLVDQAERLLDQQARDGGKDSG
jgi:hypothetical protein